jgi:aryl-alcohol dehydrogenase-like predicted oxidoreductase
MEYTTLGSTGMTVSRICLGCMSFGTGREWMLEPEESKELIERAIDLGINFFDTANVYSTGESEEILGDALAGYDRDSQVVATKVFSEMDPDNPNASGLSRKAIEQELEASLDRLGMETIDLYQTHWPDPDFGYEETMRALDELVVTGKVRILGCSNETPWGLMKSLSVSEMEGLARFETIQNNHSLNNRRFEDALAEVCRREQVSSIPYSPLAGGVLSGKYNDGARPEGARFTNYLNAGKRQQAMAQRFVNEKSMASTERFRAIAAEAGMDVVTLATAWSKQHEFVASTIVGATSVAQLEPILAAADVTLDADTLKAIDAVTRELMYPMG